MSDTKHFEKSCGAVVYTMAQEGLKYLLVREKNGFRTMDEHSLAREGHPERIKQTVYFLAEYENQDYRPQETEIASIELMDYDSAIAAFQFESFRRILTEAKTFLSNS